MTVYRCATCGMAWLFLTGARLCEISHPPPDWIPIPNPCWDEPTTRED